MLARATIQKVFIRVCRDSGFKLPTSRAAALAASVLRCHPLQIWLAMPDMDTMDLIAVGMHPAARKE